MRQLLLFLSVLFCAVSEGYAQSGENSSFLFGDYQEATVYLKNGRQVRNKMNYNLVSEKFYFIDERDGQQVKILSNVDEVNFILKKVPESRYYLPNLHSMYSTKELHAINRKQQDMAVLLPFPILRPTLW